MKIITTPSPEKLKEIIDDSKMRWEILDDIVRRYGWYQFEGGFVPFLVHLKNKGNYLVFCLEILKCINENSSK